jgi:peptidoglycan/xylan/chitin deacetylase (PgdA/CDA1 family)
VVRRVIRSASPLFRSVVSVHTTSPVVVLTLDDGPDPEWTPRILDELARRGATATFFVLLTRTRAHPELLRRIVAEGHEIALHGADHRRLTSLADHEARTMLAAGRAELESSIGAPIRWYRPPYGALSPATWRAVRRSGMTPVLWTTSVLDGRDADHAERLARATSGIEPGAIVLAHDSRAGVGDGVDDPEIAPFDRVALIADVLDEYQRRGLTAVSLANALGADAAGTGKLRRRMVLVG